ncbi:MAG TPA: response regulator, partial [Haliangiales bacterium]|nr:response regulator [Haliangiales bacterium]
MAAARRVLLIDADPHFLETLKQALHPYAVEVFVVNDGSDGLGRAAELAPELIFIAVDLPDKVGYAICNKAKKGVAKTIPVVLVTSTVPPVDLEQHRKLKVHADEYIDKRTLTVDDLVRKIDALVGLGPMMDELPIEDIPVDAEEIAFEEDAIALEESPIDSGQISAAEGFAIESTSVNVDPGIDAETEAVFAGLVETADDSFAEPATNVRHTTPPPAAPPVAKARPPTVPPSATRPFPPMPPRPPAPPPPPPHLAAPVAVVPAPTAPTK